MRALIKVQTLLFLVLLIAYNPIYAIQSEGAISDSTLSDTTSESISADSINIQPSDSLSVLSEIKAALDNLDQQQSELAKTVNSFQSEFEKLTPIESADSNYWLYLAIIVLSLLTLGSVWISFYLYRWRTLMLQNDTVLVPEAWGAKLDSFTKEIKKMRSEVGNSLRGVHEQTQQNTEKLQDMISTYLKLQEALDEKDAEIRRLRKGYDKELYRKFLYRFIRVDQTLDEILEDGEIDQNDLKMIKRFMEDAFFECGVERYSPEIGQDSTEIDGIEEGAEEIITGDKDKEYQIAEVDREGYVIKNGDQNEFLIPARVKIFVTKD